MRPTAKAVEKKLSQLTDLAKQRVRIGEIVYSTKKDAKEFDKHNWIRETEEELADAIVYMTFAFMQFETVYRMLRHTENRLTERVRDLQKLEET